MKKSSAGAFWFEIAFGVLVIAVGIIAPAFVWNMETFWTIKDTIGSFGLRLVFIGAGAALIVFALIKHFKSRGSA